MRRYACGFVLGIALCSLVGCGPRLVEVNGKVTYNGEPPNGEGCRIIFVGPQLQEVQATIAADGHYHATGVVVGPNKVAIYYNSNPEGKGREPGKKLPVIVSPLMKLPFKYADVTTSELAVNVDTGTVFDVDMKGPPLEK